MSILAGETLLEDLPLEVYTGLVKELNENSAWKLVAEYFTKTSDLFGNSWIHSLEQETNERSTLQSPAQSLLHDLNKNLSINVKMMSSILQHCELFHVLNFLHGQDLLVTVEHSYFNSNGRTFEVSIGDTFSITCTATGQSTQKYQWLHEKIELPGQTSSILTVLITSPNQVGDYECRVSQYNCDEELQGDTKYLTQARLVLKPSHEAMTITATEKAEDEESITLNCEVEDKANRKFQSCRENKTLRRKTSNTLQANNPREKVRAKIALLIANSNYENQSPLPKAENDAALIAERLTEIGFNVICLQNLTLKEMRNAITIFSQILTRDVYGLFYFVGHGFEAPEYHMMPIDIPEAYLSEHAISKGEFLSSVLPQNPSLLVVILDICLNISSQKSIPAIWEHKYDKNLILASFTCNHQSVDSKNGIFASQLAKYITRPKPVIEVFAEVAASVGASMRGNMTGQIPIIKMSIAESYRSLTDMAHHEGSSPLYLSLLDQLTIFKEQTIQITFEQCNVSCQVTLKPLKPFYLNVILLTTSGLEDWDVFYDSCPGTQVKLYPMGRNCGIYNPQRMTSDCNKGSLKIRLGKKGTIHCSKCFRYMKYVPPILTGLWK